MTSDCTEKNYDDKNVEENSYKHFIRNGQLPM